MKDNSWAAGGGRQILGVIVIFIFSKGKGTMSWLYRTQ
jgi:hypothetical protein